MSKKHPVDIHERRARTARIRPCLGCGRNFESSWNGHRFCDRCNQRRRETSKDMWSE